jgi:hypothetical protein
MRAHTLAVLVLVAGFAYIAGHVLTWFLTIGKAVS